MGYKISEGVLLKGTDGYNGPMDGLEIRGKWASDVTLAFPGEGISKAESREGRIIPKDSELSLANITEAVFLDHYYPDQSQIFTN